MAFHIEPRHSVESYRMRSVAGGYRGDYVTAWSRRIGGKLYDFSRVQWGTGETSVTAWIGGTTEVVHRWSSS